MDGWSVVAGAIGGATVGSLAAWHLARRAAARASEPRQRAEMLAAHASALVGVASDGTVTYLNAAAMRTLV